MEKRATLPGILARLSSDDIDSFPGLVAHHRQPWFHFLVQLASIALHRAQEDVPPADEEGWRELLAALTPDDADTAWSLIVEDPDRPAFMQPPTTRALHDKMKLIGAAADEIDILVRSKHHDVKAATLKAAPPHLWTYSLIALQTMQGFLGMGNYGIARMNSGFGSRVLVELVPDMSWGARFRRGIVVAAKARDRATSIAPFSRKDGMVLLWLARWDVDESLAIDRLDPLFIEVCRRVRLAEKPDGSIIARGRNSAVTRVAAGQTKGVLGDPWVPIRRSKDEVAALTVGERGFDYRRIADMLFGRETEPPASLASLPEDTGEMLLHLSVLVRGQGKTGGLLDRVIPVSPATRKGLAEGPERATLNALARKMIAQVDEVDRLPLRIGLLTLFQGPEPGGSLDFRDARPRAWRARFEREVDAVFFEHLNAMQEGGEGEDGEAARLAWRDRLASIARTVFYDALDRVPPPAIRRERARAMAENAFRALLLRTLFPKAAAETNAA